MKNEIGIPTERLLEVLREIQEGRFRLSQRGAHPRSRALVVLADRGWVAGPARKPFVTPLGLKELEKAPR